MKKKTKIILGTVIILVLISATASLYLVQYNIPGFTQSSLKYEATATSTSKTDNWETYLDSRERFTIKYPSDFHFVENGRQDYVVFCPGEDAECSANAIYVYVYTKGGSKDILNDFRKQGSGYKEKNIIINGQTAIQREKSYCMGTPRLTNGVFVEGHAYDFQIQGPFYECGPAKEGININYDESETVFNQMLSTFKFEN